MSPKFWFGQIKVKYEETPSIFASTCLQRISLPKNFTDAATFFTAMTVVVDTRCISFNHVSFSHFFRISCTSTKVLQVPYVAAGFPVFLVSRPFRSRDEFCCCTELLDVSIGAIHTK